MRLIVVLSGVVLLLVVVVEEVLIPEVSWDGRFSWTVKCNRGYISARARAVLVESAPTYMFNRAASVPGSGPRVIMLSQMLEATYIDYTSVAQTAPVQPPEQLNHGIAGISCQPPECVPRSLQPWLFNTSRLKRRRMLNRSAKSTMVALRICPTTTLLRSMGHL
jgi:hypothetical protein